MANERSTVYIPFVKLNSNQAELLEIYAEQSLTFFSPDDAKALDKQWNPIAVPLRDAGLYHDALNAICLLRKLKLTPARYSIFQRLYNYAWLDRQRLHTSHCKFDNCEGGSMQLGLALALLLNATASKVRHALATGLLSTRQYEDYDVIIEPVSQMPEKLDAIIAHRRQRLLPQQTLYCFTPTHFKADEGLLPVATLPQVSILQSLNILVKPIKRLSEAAAIIGAHQTRWLKQDYWINSLIGFGLGALLSLVIYRSWYFYPIELDMIPGKHQKQPFLVCSSNDNSQIRYFDLERDGEMPVFPLFTTSETLLNTGLDEAASAEKSPRNT